MNSKSLFNSKFISRLLPTVLVAIATAVSISGISSNKPSSIEPLVSLALRPEIEEKELKPEPEKKEEEKTPDDSEESKNSSSKDASVDDSSPGEDSQDSGDADEQKQDKEKEGTDKSKEEQGENGGTAKDNLSGDTDNSEPTKADLIDRLKAEIKKLNENWVNWSKDQSGLFSSFQLQQSLGDIKALIDKLSNVMSRSDSTD